MDFIRQIREAIAELREAFERAQTIRERLRAEMIALQEEMDWLIYAAYGLLPEDHPAVRGTGVPPVAPYGQDGPATRSAAVPAADAGKMPALQLDREQRPFRLWAAAEGDFDRAVKLIPCDWPDWRNKLWEARLATIRDNEHIRRIEQPVYKRRWDEQWKWGNQWRCGPVAYAAEFVDAFEWWLCEKAEDGEPGPGSVAAPSERRPAGEDPAATAGFPEFRREFKHIIDEETVPEGIPFAIPYDELEKKLKKPVPGKVVKVRGKLNVPRERFHLRGKSVYLWAGLQFG